MKKPVIILAVIGLTFFTFSCKKCYKCTSFSGSQVFEYCDDVYTSDQIESAKQGCISNYGTWTSQ